MKMPNVEILPVGDGKTLSAMKFPPKSQGFSQIQGFGYGTKTIARAMERIRSGWESCYIYC